MPKLGPINFDERILDAIQNNRFVVFAGAGVSMGAPASLPSFARLTSQIAEGSGIALQPYEPLDRFLGRLQHNGVRVHERAVERLSPAGSAPTSLHHDLLRLFRTKERVRIVTTNFDLHFQSAGEAIFGTQPDSFVAPALPLGGDFTGIVHIHGALPHTKSLI